MGDILNINGVVMCANILDMDTVLQGHILNVNSVPVLCDGGNSWDCNSITIFDSCTGSTEASCLGCGGTPHYEKPMSDYFSDFGANQGLVTTDYYFLDYTATTNSLSCLVKGEPKRVLIGWQLVNNGDALYASTAGLGMIHGVWSSFISAMNATGIISLPTSTNSTNLISVLSSLSPPSSYIPTYGNCKCIYNCNCIVISGSSGAYSSMTECLGDSTTCCGGCEVKSVVELAFDKDFCDMACANVCSYYYTDVVSPVLCPMSLGDHLYIDTSCTPAPKGYYSPNNCAEPGTDPCDYCYEVGALGEIIAITRCDEDVCKAVSLYADSDGLPCPDGVAKCDDADCNVCKFINKFGFYTDAQGTIPILMVGDHLYKDNDCICETNSLSNLSMGRYLWKDTTQGKDFCITLGHECLIIKKVLCDEALPDSPPPVVDEETEDETEERAQENEDDGENGPYKPKREWLDDKETKGKYYDEGGYRFYDQNGDGIVDYTERIGQEPSK